MSDTEFRWLVVIALWILVVVQAGMARGADHMLRDIKSKLDAILRLMEKSGEPD